jgi:hypothetical protein
MSHRPNGGFFLFKNNLIYRKGDKRRNNGKNISYCKTGRNKKKAGRENH